ncbi:TetR/AcrR family transcriptional regulator [Gordonia terrae]|uniref:HTH tetR-type domain-containing protein n=2 Tax=Gordonia terrae TaxID=2055 RepID=A0AAD0K597_9ACTN|nr:hypothetical protein [Gordonia terrae]VTR09634.1 transcriptional regulator BetI [Clostridioides difficile]ANY22242.1 hypothetical protein BCM27_04940 [Gordonia terrae]AWO82981.1 hypothetical protein DLJ61_04980 [Gordonia terrae]VTS30409.1 transcriptional regulator BetI [Gordonia terrae]GAB46286.1 putative TetR family transcriptional regulator [Gordonia terrae NBRC 100016]
MPKDEFVPRIDVRGPERRRQLIEATVRVLIRDGVAGVTHRSVSTEVGLPISATTYYFSTLESLLSATFRALFEAFIVDLGNRPRSGTTPSAGIDDVVDGLFSALAERADSYRVLNELQLVASRRPDLRVHSAIYWESWIQVVQDQLAVSSDTARAVIALFDGYIVAFLGTGRVPDRDHFRSTVAAIVGIDKAV